MSGLCSLFRICAFLSGKSQNWKCYDWRLTWLDLKKAFWTSWSRFELSQVLSERLFVLWLSAKEKHCKRETPGFLRFVVFRCPPPPSGCLLFRPVYSQALPLPHISRRPFCKSRQSFVAMKFWRLAEAAFVKISRSVFLGTVVMVKWHGWLMIERSLVQFLLPTFSMRTCRC